MSEDQNDVSEDGESIIELGDAILTLMSGQDTEDVITALTYALSQALISVSANLSHAEKGVEMTIDVMRTTIALADKNNMFGIMETRN